MELKELLPLLGNWGGMGILVAVLLWQNAKAQAAATAERTLLMDIIKNNTQSMQKLTDIIDTCQTVHKNG